MSALAFVFQVLGVTISISCIRGVENKYASFIGSEVLAIIMAFVLLILASGLLFLARALSVRVMVSYEGVCAQRLIRRFREQHEHIKDLHDNALIRHLSKDCRFGGRIAQEISGLVMPAGIAVVAFPVLLHLNYQATLIILFVLALTIIPYRLLGTWAQSVSYSFEKAAGEDGAYKKKVLSEIRNHKEGKNADIMPHPGFRRAYAKRLIVAHSGVLVGGLQLALCLAVISFWFTYQRRLGVEPVNMVVYAFVGVLAFNQMKAAPKVFANFHVFLAYFQRVFVLIHDIQSATPVPVTVPAKDEDDVLLDLET